MKAIGTWLGKSVSPFLLVSLYLKSSFRRDRNNIPVFFIQDGIQFPDFVHAVKPEPHNEVWCPASYPDQLLTLLDYRCHRDNPR